MTRIILSTLLNRICAVFSYAMPAAVLLTILILMPKASETALAPAYKSGGNATVTGCVATDSFPPTTHQYRAKGSYAITVTACCSTGVTQSTPSTLSITNAAGPLCNDGIIAYPATVNLREGNASETLHPVLRNQNEAPITLSGKSVPLGDLGACNSHF